MLEQIARLLNNKKGILDIDDLRKVVNIFTEEYDLSASLTNGLYFFV